MGAAKVRSGQVCVKEYRLLQVCLLQVPADELYAKKVRLL
jgi:hypothetical protein